MLYGATTGSKKEIAHLWTNTYRPIHLFCLGCTVKPPYYVNLLNKLKIRVKDRNVDTPGYSELEIKKIKTEYLLFLWFCVLLFCVLFFFFFFQLLFCHIALVSLCSLFLSISQVCSQCIVIFITPSVLFCCPCCLFTLLFPTLSWYTLFLSLFWNCPPSYKGSVIKWNEWKILQEWPLFVCDHTSEVDTLSNTYRISICSHDDKW